MRFRGVDEGQNIFSEIPFLWRSSCGRRTTNIVSTVECLGRKPHCSAGRKNPLHLAVASQAVGGGLEEHIASVRHERDSSVLPHLFRLVLLLLLLLVDVLQLLR